MSLHHAPLRALCACVALTAGCMSDEPTPPPKIMPGEHEILDFERMIRQQRFSPYQATTLFDDLKVMRNPPDGTVPVDAIVGEPALTLGVESGGYVARIPVPVTEDLLRVGRQRFETYCAPCHGVAGDGEALVAARMSLRKPPSLVDAAARSFPPGRIYRVILDGYGLMRSYREDLMSPEERWAVVAYVGALGKRRGVPLLDLPPEVRRRAEEQLR